MIDIPYTFNSICDWLKEVTCEGDEAYVSHHTTFCPPLHLLMTSQRWHFSRLAWIQYVLWICLYAMLITGFIRYNKQCITLVGGGYEVLCTRNKSYIMSIYHTLLGVQPFRVLRWMSSSPILKITRLSHFRNYRSPGFIPILMKLHTATQVFSTKVPQTSSVVKITMTQNRNVCHRSTGLIDYAPELKMPAAYDVTHVAHVRPSGFL